MWKKIILRIVIGALESIPWEKIAKAVLDRLAEKMRESGATIESLDPKEFLEDVEKALADNLGIKADLDRDGTAGE